MATPRTNASHDQNRIPTLMGVSSADGTTPVPVEVDPATGAMLTSGGGGGGGGASTIADGADVAEGATTDAAVTAGSAGTISGKLRQISADISTSNGSMSTSANQTNGNQQTKITNGTTVADVMAGDTGFNGLVIAQGAKTFSFTSSGTGPQTIGPFNVEGYSWIEIVSSSIGTGLAITGGQFAPANTGPFISYTTWANTNGGSNAPNSALNASTGAPSFGPVKGNWFQFVLSALTGGTFSGTITLRATAPPIALPVNAAQNGAWTVGSNSATGSAVPANAFFMGASDGTNLQPLKVSLADATSSISLLGVMPQSFNGANNDRLRNNTTGAVIAAGATSTNAGVSLITYNASKAVIIVNIASATAATLTVQINGITASGYSYPILTSTALATVAVTPLRIFPGGTPTANSVANDMIPRTLQIATTVTGTISYGIDYELSV